MTTRLVYKVRRKRDGKFWRLAYEKADGRRVPTFVDEDRGQEFPSTGAARNALAQKAERWVSSTHGHLTTKPGEGRLDPGDYELVEYEARLVRVRAIPLVPVSKA